MGSCGNSSAVEVVNNNNPNRFIVNKNNLDSIPYYQIQQPV